MQRIGFYSLCNHLLTWFTDIYSWSSILQHPCIWRIFAIFMLHDSFRELTRNYIYKWNMTSLEQALTLTANGKVHHLLTWIPPLPVFRGTQIMIILMTYEASILNMFKVEATSLPKVPHKSKFWQLDCVPNVEQSPWFHFLLIYSWYIYYRNYDKIQVKVAALQRIKGKFNSAVGY